jgi:FkbM family methyltransferase
MMGAILEKMRRVVRIQWRAATNAIAKRAPENDRQTRYGSYAFSYPSRSIVGRAVAEGFIWDPHLIEIVERLPLDCTVCEIGSNIGASLLTMAPIRGDLRFVCFEPSRRFLPYLRRNVEENSLRDRVAIEPQLVGPEGTRWELTSNTSTGSVVVDRYCGHIPLETGVFSAVSLDRYFARRDDPGFIKIDTDGFELQVLVSAKALLTRSHPILFVEYTPTLLTKAGNSGHALLEFLGSVGYTRADLYDGEGSLRERDHQITEPIHTKEHVDLVLR